jgi:dolichyl-phosphate beta-glucosyltransferase
MDLSIVIPAFNESGKIADDIRDAAEFLTNNNLSGEIIVVDDGSRDGTAEVAKNSESALSGQQVSAQVLTYLPHRGKGYAIRKGMAKTTGKYAMFADSGSCIPYEEALRGLELIEDGKCDIAHGSRKTLGCHIFKSQSRYRRICSKLFHLFVIYDMKIPAEFSDTQCGFKIYRGDIARELYAQCITDGFMFDIEIIMRAQRRGCRISEFPVDWTCDRDSRLSPARSAWQVFSELMTIRRLMLHK